MKKTTISLMVVALCGVAVAGPDWNNATGDGLWTTGANWIGGNAPATGGADNNPAIHGQAVGPTINVDVGVMGNVWHGVFGTQPGALVMTTGGRLLSNEYILGSQNDSYNDAVITMDGGWLQANTFKIGDSQSGRVDISGGVMTAYNPGNQLLVGASGDWSRGKINITGTGEVRADALLMNTSAYQQDSRILINDSGVLKLKGDQTGTGTDLMTYIGNGWIHTTDSGKSIGAVYDPGWGETIVSNGSGWTVEISADINIDGAVNYSDFARVARSWMADTSDGNYDALCNLTGSSVIDEHDLQVLMGHWLGDAALLANLDFELGTFEGWHTTDNAFSSSPQAASGRIGSQGSYISDSISGGEAAIGTLRSKPFVLTENGVKFKIAGHNHQPGISPTNSYNYVELRRNSDDLLLDTVWAPQSDSFQKEVLCSEPHIGQEVYINVVDSGSVASFASIAADNFWQFKSNREFEHGNYDGWTKTGSAWGNTPTQTGGPCDYWQGAYFASTFDQGESATGTLQSENFLLTLQGVDIRIAGHNYWPGVHSTTNHHNYVALYRASDDVEIDRVWAPNHDPLAQRKLSSYANLGEEVYIKIVDDGSDVSFAWMAVDSIYWYPETTPSFDSGAFNGWMTTGTAWGAKPVNSHPSATGWQGEFFADTAARGETAVGTLTSEPFVLMAEGVELKIAGWNHWPNSQPENSFNYVALKRASDDVEIDRVWAPQQDAFVQATLSSATNAGNDVYIEVVDNGSEVSYAWIAVDDFRFAPQPTNKTPYIGTGYLTWFSTGYPEQEDDGSVWKDDPFGLADVQSKVFWNHPDGFAYSSLDPHTAEVHAYWLDKLGVDFAMLDASNLSKATPAPANPIFQGGKATFQGFRNRTYTDKLIKCAWMLSLTCWADQCHGIPGDYREILTYNDNVASHIEEIAELAILYPESFVEIDGKPLLTFYLNYGDTVYNIDTGEKAFHGAGNLYPTESDWDPTITLRNGDEVYVRDFFSVRWVVAARGAIDFASYSTDIWPFLCPNRYVSFGEVGYSSVHYKDVGTRSSSYFNAAFDAYADKDFHYFNLWNGFSSTDESPTKGYYTLEPNTQLYKHDGTPGGTDPWYWYNVVKGKFNP